MEIVSSEAKTELHFEKVPWFKRYFYTNRALKKQIESLMEEHIQWLKKMQEMNDTGEQLRKLNRLQAVEVRDLLDRAITAEQKLEAAKADLDLIQKGIQTHPGEIKAVTIVKVSDQKSPLYSPLVLTLNSSATEIISREVLPETEFNYALDQGKIKFMELFDPMVMN